MGSGSTGLAAIREGRNFLGIDLSPHYVDIARRRFKEELEVGTWSGELSVQAGSDAKDMACSSAQAVK